MKWLKIHSKRICFNKFEFLLPDKTQIQIAILKKGRERDII